MIILLATHISLQSAQKTSEKLSAMGAPTIPNMVNQLKGYVTKRIGFSVWQKLYYDHIIRDEDDYNTKWEYIENNSAAWFDKKEN